jgi:predicted nucleotidyltransferase
MPSAVQKKSYGSVKVFWLDEEFLKEKLKESAYKLIQEKPEVKKVVLFGSLAQNRATAFSDADILIEVANSSKRFIDRPDEFREYFEGVGFNVDLLVYTQEEIAQGLPFIERALRCGECLGFK